MYKRIIGGLVSMLLCGGSAMAADLEFSSYKAPPNRLNWTGCYIGLNGGGESNRLSGSSTIGPVTGFSPAGVLTFPIAGSNNSEATGLLGGQLGCHWQSSQLVFGIEGDFEGTDLRQTFTAPAGTVLPFAPGDAFTFRNHWQGSLRGRLGWAVDHWLFYTTGGLAWANLDASMSAVAVGARPAGIYTQSDSVMGATVGAGIEYAFNNSLSLAAEYRYTGYEHANLNFSSFVQAPGVSAPFAATMNLRTHEVTARLNWHFSPLVSY